MFGKALESSIMWGTKKHKRIKPAATIETAIRSLVDRYSDPAKQDSMKKMRVKFATGVFGRRRKKALLRILPVVKEKCFPTSDSKAEDYMTEAFLYHEIETDIDYNMLDSNYAIRLGAAIWILDNLKRAGNLEKALDHLTNIGNDKDDHILPEHFYHPCYSNAVLESMMFVITMRFKTLQEMDQGHIPVPDSIVLEDNAEGREYNAAFREIMELLPKDALESVDRAAADQMDNFLLPDKPEE